MSMPLSFRSAARKEFTDAVAWYDAQRKGLGAAFVAAVNEMLGAVADQPYRYPAVYGDVREALVSRFPYCVYYRVKTNRIVIIAVFHGSRDPSIWQARA
jgi:toxin ParE1/3/4